MKKKIINFAFNFRISSSFRITFTRDQLYHIDASFLLLILLNIFNHTHTHTKVLKNNISNKKPCIISYSFSQTFFCFVFIWVFEYVCVFVFLCCFVYKYHSIRVDVVYIGIFIFIAKTPKHPYAHKYNILNPQPSTRAPPNRISQTKTTTQDLTTKQHYCTVVWFIYGVNLNTHHIVWDSEEKEINDESGLDRDLNLNLLNLIIWMQMRMLAIVF